MKSVDDVFTELDNLAIKFDLDNGNNEKFKTWKGGPLHFEVAYNPMKNLTLLHLSKISELDSSNLEYILKMYRNVCKPSSEIVYKSQN